MTTDTIGQISCPVSGIRIEKNLGRFNISSRMGSNYRFDYTNLSNQRHYHDCYEFVLVLDGKGTFQHMDESRVLSKGDLFVSDPDTLHEIHIKPNEELILFYFFLHIHQKATLDSMSENEKIVASFLKEHRNYTMGCHQLLAYMNFFQSYAGNRSPNLKYWLTRTLENFLFECIESASTVIPGKEVDSVVYGNDFEKILDYIDQNLEKKLTADEIATYACTSKRNLYNIFRRRLNQTVNDYINQRKILLAEHYLSMNISISEAANLVGIESISYFSKLFKKYKEISPAEYRRKCMTDRVGYGRRLE